MWPDSRYGEVNCLVVLMGSSRKSCRLCAVLPVVYVAWRLVICVAMVCFGLCHHVVLCHYGVSWFVSPLCLMVCVTVVSDGLCHRCVSWFVSPLCLMVCVTMVSDGLCHRCVSWFVSPWCMMVCVTVVSHGLCHHGV